MKNVNIQAVVLAAGKSTRFNTDKTKLAYTVCGKQMILFPLEMLKKLEIPTILTVGYQKEELKNIITQAGFDSVDFVTQEKQLGTGNAIACSSDKWVADNILILNGDMPLLKAEIIQTLIEKHNSQKAVLSFVAAHCLNPYGYGRVIKEINKASIVEEKNCTEEQKNITLVNAGIYLISREFLLSNIDKLSKNSVSGEIYVTDLAEIASKQDMIVQVLQVPYDNVRGVNTLEELWAVEQVKRSELMKYWMGKGVRFELAQSIHLDIEVEIGQGSFIGTGVHILNGTKIGKNCTINAFSIIENSIIDDNTQIRSHSVIQDSKLGKDVVVGPFARLRGDVVLADKVQIGNFVEIKNSKIEEGSKAKHLTYIGDAQLGKSVNVGAGTITCNYDGKNKHKTIIEDNVFIGSNNSLIAPIKIGKNSYTAAGSALNKDVPQDSLAIARAKQENKTDYLKKNKKDTTSQSSSNGSNNGQIKFDFIGAIKADDIQEIL